MKISLRQARRVEREIGSEVELATNGGRAGAFTVTVYENLAEKLKAVQEKASNDISTISALTAIRFKIRKAIETANEVSGINALMNREAELKTMAKVLTIVMVGELTAEEEAVAIQRHATLKAQVEAGTAPQSRYGEPTDAISLNHTMSTERMNSLRGDAKIIQRELLKTVEKLSALNAATEIELTDADVKVLEKNDIIVS